MNSREKKRNSNQRSSSSIIDTLPSDTSAEHSSGRVARPKSEGAGQPPRFLECLVTPKLTFSLRHEGWSSASDIDQDVIRAAFLTRFSLPIDCSKLTFSVVGSPKLDDDTTKLVMRIKHEDADEERVMLRILTSIEEAFETKYKEQLAAAREDMLSSSMTFQVMASEIRERQAESDRAREAEINKINAHLGSTSKRLFLMEQEKNQKDMENDKLRNAIMSLEGENRSLRARMEDITEQLNTLRSCVEAQPDSAWSISGQDRPTSRGDGPVGLRWEAATQTDTDGATRVDLVRLSECLARGSELFGKELATSES